MLITDDLLTWALSQAAARSHRLLQLRLSDAGFTGYEYRLLRALAGGDAVNQTELGRRAALDRSDVTVSIRQLRARGLVARRPDPNHGRRVLITMTPSGTKNWTKAERVMARVQDEVFSSLSEHEREVLRSLLARVGAPVG